eukprot:TRINITY_DN17469_c0_g1_i1.p1 TRINITY_DN17469_c0_g1~~TRINITY_DN17469_c0_g1_i1.p1  ORF type:complete len:696 (-),score=87.41 TRINITY_DN17469_c0_g1_i1:454-2541(-)
MTFANTTLSADMLSLKLHSHPCASASLQPSIRSLVQCSAENVQQRQREKGCSTSSSASVSQRPFRASWNSCSIPGQSGQCHKIRGLNASNSPISQTTSVAVKENSKEREGEGNLFSDDLSSDTGAIEKPTEAVKQSSENGASSSQSEVSSSDIVASKDSSSGADTETVAAVKKSVINPAVSTQKLSLDDVNPVGLGRRSRQLFDDVWRRLIQLGQLTQPPLEEEYESVLVQGPICDFTTPNAEYTTVLVAGATGRVGRVLVRKLLLRGYSVKALLRSGDAGTLERLPRAVQAVEADLGDIASLRSAVEGCNKIIFCARARSGLTADMVRVEQQGVDNLARAFLDHNHRLAERRRGRSAKSKLTIAKFSRPEQQEGWELREGSTSRETIIDPQFDGGMDAELEFTEKGTAVFKGYVFTRGGYVEAAYTLALPEGTQLGRYEGLLLNLIGDGRSYQLLLTTGEYREDGSYVSCEYFVRFTTRLGYSRVRLPFSSFRPLDLGGAPLDVGLVKQLAFRFEPKRQSRLPLTARSALARKINPEGDGASPRDESSFRLELDFIKALPGGEETDFILVSCTGAGVPPERREKVLKTKMNGETILRNSGLGYTIVRPGLLREEPGGQKALVFDQGNRISQGISCADVADVCVKSMHDPSARNKSFDVCYEYPGEQGLYELVAHLPDKSSNYLTPALQVLEKNT